MSGTPPPPPDPSGIDPELIAEFDTARARPLHEHIRLSFRRTYRPVLDDEPYRSFDTMAHYRAWCEEHLPSWLGYPEQSAPPAPGQLRAGAHSDYGVLTILRTEDAPGGLQVRTRAGRWSDVSHIPGSFVVNIGDAMMRWTDDRWVSTQHRVVNPPVAPARSLRGVSR